MGMTPEARQQIFDAATDPAAVAARRALLNTLSSGFHECGQLLRACGVMLGTDRISGASPLGNGTDALVALGYLSQSAHALVGGIETSLTSGNAYAAAALLRHLVEVEYLMWAFAEDEQEAASWLRSTKDERLSRWQPRHLRSRSAGRFRTQDYSLHCDLGGHPTPDGFRQLLDLGDSSPVPDLLRAETATHAVSAWRYLLVAAEKSDDGRTFLPSSHVGEANRYIEVWRSVERVSGLAVDST